MNTAKTAAMVDPVNKVNFVLSLTPRELRDLKSGIKVLRKSGFNTELAADILLNSKLQQKYGASAVFDHNS